MDFIANLTRLSGGNVHRKQVVNVTASSVSDGKLENVVDYPWSGFGLCSEDSPNSWICYDFGGLRVTPTSYTIFSCDSDPGGPHHKSWVLEVSLDGSKGSWKVVDSRENNSDLNDKCVIRNFAISAPQSEAFRFVRLCQTGKNHCGDHRLAICALELFGSFPATECQTT